MKQSWRVSEYSETEISGLADACGIDPVITGILYSRGLRTADEITRFLNPGLSDLHSPFLLDGMYEAVIRLKRAFLNGDKIAIFSDSDIDGITSLAIINDLLVKFKNTPYIRYPREREGYGLTCDIIDEFVSRGIQLVITVDSGIRDTHEISYGRSRGIDFIVTDHHEPDVLLPDAIIINPKIADSSYPFKDLAGVGVAFKLAHALLFSYMNFFDVRFILVSPVDNGYAYTFIRNGLVTGNGVIETGNMEYFASSIIRKGDFIVFAGECGDLQEYFGKDGGVTLTELFRLGSGILQKEYRSHNECVDDLVRLFRLPQLNRVNNHDLSVKLFMELQMRSSEKVFGVLRDYIVLVAMGTIADIMPVHGENRQMIKYGISVINSGGGHPGIRELLGKAQASSKSISWDVAPLLNTPGRMGVTELTVEFFLTDNTVRIHELISDIQKLNKERKKIVTETMNRVREKSDASDPSAGFFVYSDESIRDGLAGLIANRIADEIKKPVIIMSGADLEGNVKGSGRSYGKFNFLQHVEPYSALFERLGGHSQAFGFTIKKSNIETAIEKIAGSIGNGHAADEVLRIDMILNTDLINAVFIDRLSLLEPFGKDNDEPVFLSRNVSILSCQVFGSDSAHGKYIIPGGIQAIGWNMAEIMMDYYRSGGTLDIVYKLGNNIYLNRTYPRMMIIDIDYSR